MTTMAFQSKALVLAMICWVSNYSEGFYPTYPKVNQTLILSNISVEVAALIRELRMDTFKVEDFTTEENWTKPTSIIPSSDVNTNDNKTDIYDGVFLQNYLHRLNELQKITNHTKDLSDRRVDHDSFAHHDDSELKYNVTYGDLRFGYLWFEEGNFSDIGYYDYEWFDESNMTHDDVGEIDFELLDDFDMTREVPVNCNNKTTRKGMIYKSNDNQKYLYAMPTSGASNFSTLDQLIQLEVNYETEEPNATTIHLLSWKKDNSSRENFAPNDTSLTGHRMAYPYGVTGLYALGMGLSLEGFNLDGAAASLGGRWRAGSSLYHSGEL